MLDIICILQNIKYMQHVRSWLHLHLQTLCCHTDVYCCYWFHSFDISGRNPFNTKRPYVDHIVVCNEVCIHSCTVTDMKDIKIMTITRQKGVDQTPTTSCMLCTCFRQEMMSNIIVVLWISACRFISFAHCHNDMWFLNIFIWRPLSLNLTFQILFQNIF